jgi:hypothetical protein
VDGDVTERLDRIERALADVIRQQEALLEKHTVKDFYTTAESAAILGRAEYTVREWCRHGQVRAEKRGCGRGLSKEWIIPHVELTRIRNEGPSPLGTFWEQREPRKAHAG